MSFKNFFHYNTWSIRTKLILLALISATVAVAITGVSMVRKDIASLKEAKAERLTSQARMIAFNSTGVLSFLDSEAATKLLQSLETEPTIERACLYDADGKLFASYTAKGYAGDAPVKSLGKSSSSYCKYDANGELVVSKTIFDQEDYLGTVILQANSSDVQQKLNANFSVIMIVTLTSLAIAMFLSGFLQRNISNPITKLSKTAKAISQSGDYSLRVQIKSGDELGLLGDAFNTMLSQVEDSKLALTDAHNKLEERVVERTKDLEEANEYNAAIQEAALDAIVVMDNQGRIADWNPQAEKVFGWRAEEVLGKRVSEVIIPGEMSEQHENGYRRFLKTGVSKMLNRRIETNAVRRDGTEFPIEIALVSISEGEKIKFCGFIRDVTDRRKTEEAMQNAKEAAEASNRAKSEFLANMSHEIRTPLNGILGFTDLLIRDENADAEERRDYLETIQSSGKHLLGLINDILDLSKIEAGQYEVEILPCPPQQIIAEVTSFLRVTALEKGLELNCRWEGLTPVEIQTDPGRFKQILTNLIGNAIKFTEKGSVDIVARIEDHKKNPQLIVDIEDTGIGIEPEKLDEIFSPFAQADNTVTRRFGGTGLGLTICRQMADALEGDVAVKSTPGQGSTFTLTLPTGSLAGVEMVDLSTSDGIGQREKKAAKREYDLSGIEILLVEDGITNRKLISLAIRRAGGNITEAENGKIGVELALAGSFDMIFMDMQMPVMDGYTATRLLREKNVTLPIVALTAHAMKGDQKKCREAGCSGYLTKPVDIDDLISTVALAVGLEASSNATTNDDSLEPKNAKAPRGPVYSTLPTEDEDFREIVSEFIPRMQAHVEELSEAIQQEAWDKAKKLAHWLKGAGGTAGFAGFTEPTRRLCENIEFEEYATIKNLLNEILELSELAAIRPSGSETMPQEVS